MAEITDKVRQVEVMKRITRTHTDAGLALDDIAAIGAVHPDTEAKINALWRDIVVLRDVVPRAIVGEKFTSGRKPGTGGKIRGAIAKLLKHGPMKNNDLWDALASAPPRGWVLYNNERIGKYIEGPRAGDGMEYGRFCNIASEERKKLEG